MNEENKNTITYDDDWKSAINYEYPVTVSSENTEEENQSENFKKPKKKSDSPKQLLITIQLIMCILIALAAFIIKGVGGDFYAAAREVYYSQLNNSAIFDNFNNSDIGDLFTSSTKDEV